MWAYIIGVLLFLGLIGWAVDSCKSAVGLGGKKQISTNREMQLFIDKQNEETERKITQLEELEARRRVEREEEAKAAEDRYWAEREVP